MNSTGGNGTRQLFWNSLISPKDKFPLENTKVNLTNKTANPLKCQLSQNALQVFLVSIIKIDTV